MAVAGSGPIQFGLGTMFILFVLSSVFFVLLSLAEFAAAAYAVVAVPALVRALIATRYVRAPMSGMAVFSIFAQSFAAVALSVLVALVAAPVGALMGLILGSVLGEPGSILVAFLGTLLMASAALLTTLRAFWTPWPPSPGGQAAFGWRNKGIDFDAWPVREERPRERADKEPC